KAIANFHEGRAVIGQCAGARLPVPVYETAFALAKRLEETSERERVRITIVSPGGIGSEFGDSDVGITLQKALDRHQIEFLPDFPIEKVTEHSALTGTGQPINFD